MIDNDQSDACTTGACAERAAQVHVLMLVPLGLNCACLVVCYLSVSARLNAEGEYIEGKDDAEPAHGWQSYATSVQQKTLPLLVVRRLERRGEPEVVHGEEVHLLVVGKAFEDDIVRRS